jgi:DNA-binding NtrC family response regulator
MVETPATILLVEDTVALASAYSAVLENEGLSVEVAHLGAEALRKLAEENYALVLLDLQLPDADGLELLREIRAGGDQTTVIVVTSDASVDRAIDAIRGGARDYLVKPLAPERLLTTVRNVLELVSLRERVMDEAEPSEFQGFIGASKAMQAIYRSVANIAPSSASVFITGESGTGKELCAEAIHRLSGRPEGPFIAINCGAIPKDLIETELFGHVKGAFTGAIANRDGAASLADGGTLFLDEICEMDVSLQTKLLRFLQTSSFQRVGSQKTERVDVRVVCATNRDPVAELAAGRFREDLYYRLNVIPIHLPPLREREDDVLLIADRFFRRFAEEEGKAYSEIGPEAADAIRAYRWPGNVRELENVVRRVVVMNPGAIIEADMLPREIGAPTSQALQAPDAVSGDNGRNEPEGTKEGQTLAEDDGWVPAGRSLADIERAVIEATIRRCDGSVTKAAHVLDVSPSTLYRKRSAWADS